MAKDHDFKRLVRERMQDTGERYTEARAALVAQRYAGDRGVSDRTRSLIRQERQPAGVGGGLDLRAS